MAADLRLTTLDRRSFLKGVGGLAGLAALGPLLAACGDDAGAPGASEGGGGGSGALGSMQLQMAWLPNAQAAGEYVALERGYFDDAGVEVELVTGGPEVNVMSLLGSGAVPAAVSYQANTILARAQGVPVTAFAATLQRAPLTYYSFERNGVSTIEDFAGKTFGVPPDGEPFLRSLLESNGMSIDDVQIERSGASAATALLEDQVDVVGMWDINIGALGPLLGEDDLVSFSLYDHGMRQQSNLYVATEDTIANDTNLLAAILEAVSKGWEWAADNPEEAIEIVARVGDVDLDVEGEVAGLDATLAYVFNEFTAEHGWGALNEEVWQDAIDTFDEYGMLDNPVTVDQVITNEVLDASERVVRG